MRLVRLIPAPRAKAKNGMVIVGVGFIISANLLSKLPRTNPTRKGTMAATIKTHGIAPRPDNPNIRRTKKGPSFRALAT